MGSGDCGLTELNRKYKDPRFTKGRSIRCLSQKSLFTFGSLGLYRVVGTRSPIRNPQSAIRNPHSPGCMLMIGEP